MCVYCVYLENQVSREWQVLSNGDNTCLIGSESLCPGEIQVFHTTEVVAEGGVLSITSRVTEMTGDGFVGTASSGLMRTIG